MSAMAMAVFVGMVMMVVRVTIFVATQAYSLVLQTCSFIGHGGSTSPVGLAVFYEGTCQTSLHATHNYVAQAYLTSAVHLA